MATVLAIDSNIFIAALSGHEEQSGLAQELIKMIAGGTYRATASSIVFGEILSVSSESSALDLQDFFSLIPHLQTVPANDAICAKAGQLRIEYGKGLKLPDALHVATALFAKAEIFVTNDKALARIANKIILTTLLSDLPTIR